MPKLWQDTIEAHRSAVAGQIMDRTAAVAAAEGLHALTMARVAQEAGIGRATLYKYFKDVPEILGAWHRRQISAHLSELEAIRDQNESPVQALESVLTAYGLQSAHDHHGNLSQMLHAQPHVHEAHDHLQAFVADLIARARDAGQLGHDGSADDAASYAISAMRALPPAAARPAVTRLVAMVLRGLGR